MKNRKYMIFSLHNSAKFNLTTLSVLILTACGSGGSNSSTNHHATPQQTSNQSSKILQPKHSVQPNNAQPNPHTDSIASSTQPNTEKHMQPNPHTDSIAPATQPNTEKHMQPTPPNHTGGYTVINRRDKEKIHPLTNIDINKINIDDENIDIMLEPSEDINSPWTIYSQSNRDIIICCEKYSSTRFGIIDSPNESIPTYIFYNGKPTQSMPLGKASYSGEVIGGIGEYNKKTGYNSGISKFDVDFDEKKLKGTLTIKNIKPVHIDANIQNNTFTGTATSDAFKSDTKVEVQGKFFGENAKELGGIAESHDYNFGAAFGAKK